MSYEMRIRTIKSQGLAALSYFVSSEEWAMVIDPRRDVEIYQQLAVDDGVDIVHIFETHRNEDYVTGSLELQGIFPDARIGHSDQTNFQFGDDSIADSETFSVGKMKVTCIQTPGHTLDSICYAVADISVGPDPIIVFTGDTLFVSEVGRTDLVDKKKHEEMSRKLYNSLHEKLVPQGDGVIVYPGHGAGSVCGGDIATREFSTIGYERANNRWLSMNEEEFVEAKINQELTLSSYFKHCEHMNTVGPPLVVDMPEPSELDVEQLSKLIEDNSHRAIDIGPSEDFLESHIPGSISLSITNMGRLVGLSLRPNQTFSIILRTDHDDWSLASVMLRRIGYDHILGYLKDGLKQWVKSGRKTSSIEKLSLDEFGARQTRGEVIVVDVREPHEYHEECIEHSISVPLTSIEEIDLGFAKDGPITTICPSGNRSTTAASILKHRGVEDISVSLDGLKAWRAHDYPLIRTEL
jgi:hydroxyacylglutathione hydrolase